LLFFLLFGLSLNKFSPINKNIVHKTQHSIPMIRFLTLALYLSLITQSVYSQVIEGVITDDNQRGIESAHIRLDGTELATVSDSDGYFSLNMTGIDTALNSLIISKIGYQTEVFELNMDTTRDIWLEIKLREIIYESETMVITATRTRRDVEEVSIPVSVISGIDIQRSGSMRLSDVLSEQTGMQITNDHGTGIQVQGFDPDYTLVMIDGNPIIGRTAGTLDLTRISVRNVEQIEIIKGPSSALWGSDALAGVINIITEKSNDALKAGILARYGENNTFDLSGDISYNLEGWSNDVFINRNSSGGYSLNQSSIEQTVPEFENYTFNYRTTMELTNRIQFESGLRYFTEKQQNRSSLPDENGNLQLLISDASREDFVVRPTIKMQPIDRLDLNLNWMISYFKSNSDLEFEQTGENYSASQFNQYYNKPEIQAGFQWDTHHHSIIGGGAIFERLNAERYPNNPEFTTQFLFIQHSWFPFQQFELIGGLRFDTHSEYNSQLSPKLSSRYRFNDWIQVRASLGSGFKAPEFRQLFLDFTNTTAGYSVFGSSTVAEGIARQIENGNIAQILIPIESLEEIRAESSWAANIGFDFDPVRTIRFRVNFFRNNVSDLIETAPVAQRTNGQSVFTYFNVDEVFTQGLEAEIRIRFGENFRGSIGYQFLDAKRRIERELTIQDDQGEVIQRTDISFEPMFNRSRNSGNIRLFYDSKGGWGANLRGTYRGQYGLFDSNGNGFVDENEYEQGYFIWNLALSRKIGKSLTLQAGVDNLFNYTNMNQPYLAGRLWYTQVFMQF